MTWSDVAVAGAFVVGIVVGGLGAIQIMRVVMSHTRRFRRNGDDG